MNGYTSVASKITFFGGFYLQVLMKKYITQYDALLNTSLEICRWNSKIVENCHPHWCSNKTTYILCYFLHYIFQNVSHYTPKILIK